MEFYAVKSAWGENRGMTLHRPNIGDNYIFIHFKTPVKAELNGIETDIKPGGCIFYESFSEQKFSSPDCPLVHDWFHADTETCRILTAKYGIECSKVYYPSDTGEISDIISKIELEYLKKDRFTADSCNALAQRLFIALARSEQPAGNCGSVSKYREHFLHIRSKIHSDVNPQITVDDMATLANMSVSRFFYLYKEIFGISPKKDLSNLRLQRAKILLSGSDKNIEEIAELSGYANQYTFIRKFKKDTGITPGRYRKSNSAAPI